MDNASKALIMAGGVLIAVMVIGVSMYILSSAREVAYTSNKTAEENARESFNRYYQSFGNDTTILGIDMLNLCEKADDDSMRSTSLHEVNYSVPEGKLDELRKPQNFLNQFKYSYRDGDNDGYIDTLEFTAQ